jgi:hypothetical protein
MRTLLTFGLGALTMYLLDPEQGRRRRALLRDQVTHLKTLARERTAGATRDLSNRAYGAAMEARRAVSTQLEPGETADTPAGARHLGR